MIKRITAVSLTVLATLILFAHAVIPHHHHKSQVCLASTHCQSDRNAHDHESASQGHQHDGTGGSENCLLKQLVTLPPNRFILTLSELDQKEVLLGVDAAQSAMLLAGPNFQAPEIPSLACYSLPFSRYNHLASHSSGSRAPPLV
jgi:hypothetical protein